MVYFILDTSTDRLVMGLSPPGGPVSCQVIPHENHLSRLLLPLIHNFLQQEGVHKKELTCICAGIGPGSYTGTRSGVIVAQTLGYALQIPQIPFCSLLAFLPPLEGSFSYLHSTSRKNQHHLLRGEIRANRLSNLDLQHISDLSPHHVFPTDHLIIGPTSAGSFDFNHPSTHTPTPYLPILSSYLHETDRASDQIAPHLPLSLIYSSQPGA